METIERIGSFASLPRYLELRGHRFALAPGMDLIQCRYEEDRLSALVAMRRARSRAGAEWLAIGLPICSVQSIQLRAALIANDELPIGGLAVTNGVVLVRQTLPLVGLLSSHLDHALATLVRTAAELAVAATRAATDPDVETAYRYLFR